MAQDPRAPEGPARPGQRISHYEIVGEIGRGGMGVIYRARDLTLGRSVALKCPWPADPNPRQRSRFMREARAASQLSHPHIVPLFEVLEEDGVPWLAMELVEGATLRSLLSPGRSLPVLEALRHAEGLAAALQAAHGRNILHRDVNPNNVMVTADGRAVLTDFGLAQFVRVAETASTQTRDSEADGEGRVVGTPHYMSPEQALGKPLDPRSDIFSLGAVLYEMCTGDKAFPGARGDVVDAILHREPTSVSRLNYEVPEELERIIRKALAKSPDERYQDARDLLVDIRTLRRRIDHGSYVGEHVVEPPPRRMYSWLVGAALIAAVAVFGLAMLRGTDSAVSSIDSAPSYMRVGVLPHVQAAGSGGDAAWPELVQALYVRELTGVQDLGVLDPMSLNGLLEAKMGTRQAGRGPELYSALRSTGVTYVVDGTVRPSRNGVRIQTSVVDPASGEVKLTVDGVARDEDDMATAVAALAHQVLAFLQLKGLSGEENKDLRPWLSHRVKNVEAVRAFVQASEYASRGEPGAGPHLRRAIELDPTFVAPRVWLISAHRAGGDLETAKEHHRHLQRIEAQASPFDQAMIRWAGAAIAGDRVAEARHLEVALTYSPGNNIILMPLAELRFRAGAFEPALAAVEAPIAARWKFSGLHSFRGACLLALGRFDDAKRTSMESLAAAPRDRDLHAILAVVFHREGNTEQAAEHRRQYLAGKGGAAEPPAVLLDGLATLYLLAGQYHPGAETLAEALAADGGRLEPASFWSGMVYGTWKGAEIVRAVSAEVTANPGWKEAHLVRARALEVQGRSADALRHYETFAEADPRSAAAAGARFRAQGLRRPGKGVGQEVTE